MTRDRRGAQVTAPLALGSVISKENVLGSSSDKSQSGPPWEEVTSSQRVAIEETPKIGRVLEK